ncbi:hypothetical protein N658DRAFT_489580 [Parathielavia hyrcaniae]|uniref:Uncharacterized protein n=1 Tax=Parathielavia hyrcaniae TaxID=113614 RepID=A0AAN6SXG8_9PEZI|nr:hypothetical protein N658DRAFT_489580 [Parathielavia hyrcaniae]
MSANRDGNRIYFCVYFQQGPSGTAGNPPVFHCGLWFEKKQSRGIEVMAEHLHQVCEGVPVPKADENCWDWTHYAIEGIQARNWLSAFPWEGNDGFAARAYNQAVK